MKKENLDILLSNTREFVKLIEKIARKYQLEGHGLPWFNVNIVIPREERCVDLKLDGWSKNVLYIITQSNKEYDIKKILITEFKNLKRIEEIISSYKEEIVGITGKLDDYRFAYFNKDFIDYKKEKYSIFLPIPGWLVEYYVKLKTL